MTAKDDERKACEQGEIFMSPKGELDFANYNSIKSISHYFLPRLNKEYSDKFLIVDVDSGRRWTGHQIYEKILNIATCLLDHYDFQQGTFVTITHHHSDITILLALGVVCAGGSVSYMNPSYPYGELLYLAKKIDPKFLFCQSKQAHWIEDLCRDLGHDVEMILMDGPNVDSGDIEHVERFLNYNRQKSKSSHRVPIPAKNIKEDVAFVLTTSGSTGKPKVVPATHWNCIMDNSLVVPLNGVTFACSQTLNYVSGRLLLLGSLIHGYTICLIKSFEVESFCRAIEDYQINVIYLGAASFYELITYHDLDKYDMSSLKIVFPMGAKVTYIEEMAKFFEKYPNIEMARTGYGSSEFGGAAVSMLKTEEFLADHYNCGILGTSVAAKILDPETGQLLGRNKVGLLRIKSPNMFPGYYDVTRMQSKDCKSPFIRDSSIFDEDGFYKTGDLAYINNKDQLYIIGREKEVMNCNDKKVLPQDLEEVIGHHPAVHQVCVMGIADQKNPSNHCPRAFIVPKRECYTDGFTKLLSTDAADEESIKLDHRGVHKLSKMDEKSRRQLAEDIMKFVDKRVSLPKRLTGGIVILDDIPTLDSTGKLNKLFLRSLDEDQVELYGDRSFLEI